MRMDEIVVERRHVKNARISILPDGIIRVVAPPNFDVESFVREHAEWIEKRKNEIEEVAKEIKGKEDLFLFNGKFYHLVTDESFEVQKGDEIGIVKYRTLKNLKKELVKLLRDELKDVVAFYSRLLGVKYRRIFIRMQKTKWASCSSKLNLSFNLATLALPRNLREYIVIHELTHLIEPKHSKAFWELVGFYYPDYRRAEEELKTYWIFVERNKVWKKMREIR